MAQSESRSLRGLFRLRDFCVKPLPDPDPVVTIQCRGIRNYDLLAFAQPVEYLDGADGVAAEFNCATLSFSAIRTEDKHADRLLRLPKRGPADFQDILESLELDRSVHAQIRTRTRGQRTFQMYVDLESAFTSCRVDA